MKALMFIFWSFEKFWVSKLSGGADGAERVDIRTPGSFCQLGSKILSDEY